MVALALATSFLLARGDPGAPRPTGGQIPGGGERPGSQDLRAFQRHARAGDAIPRGALGPLTKRFGRIVASRRIAATTGFRGSAALYLVRLRREYTCLVQIDRGAAGAGCSPSRYFLSVRRRVSAGGGDGFLHGVVANDVTRVAFVDRNGTLHPLRLTRDGGFIYMCRARNGCVKVIKGVNGYDRRGRLVSHQRW